MKKITLKITDMHCTSCAISIDFALEDIGVQSKTNYAKGETEIEFDSDKLTIDKVIREIKNAGYTAVVI